MKILIQQTAKEKPCLAATENVYLPNIFATVQRTVQMTKSAVPVHNIHTCSQLICNSNIMPETLNHLPIK